jgi:putative hydrolase of the HAD superfamily
MWSDGSLALDGDRLILHSEPGKHAFAPSPAWYAPMQAAHPRAITRELSGLAGVLVTPLFTGKIARTPLADTHVRTYLARHTFTPAWDFAQQYEFAPSSLVPWPVLERWIPDRVAWWVAYLARTIAPIEYRPLRIGQRPAPMGGRGNTLASLQRATERNVDLVGVRLALTADQVVVAASDSTVIGPDGRALPIATSILEELQTPTLDQVVAACETARIGLFIELASRATIAPMLQRLQELDMLSSSLIAATRPDWLLEIKALAPRAITVYQTESRGPESLAIAQACQVDFIQLCWEVHELDPAAHLPRTWVSEIQSAGLGVIGWYSEDPHVQAELRRVGLDGDCNLGPLAPIYASEPNSILAICIDFGDTLADEATEIKDAGGVTQRAALIPGAAALVQTLRARGYRLALVADGRPGTYRNVLSQHGLYDDFDAFAISDYLGSEKPNPRNFAHALTQLGIGPDDYRKTVMLGNYLAADIKGANALGMLSIWLDWAPRRPKIPADPSETPHHAIQEPLALLAILDTHT